MSHFTIELDGFDLQKLMEGGEVEYLLRECPGFYPVPDQVTITTTPNAIRNYNDLKKKE